MQLYEINALFTNSYDFAYCVKSCYLRIFGAIKITKWFLNG